MWFYAPSGDIDAVEFPVPSSWLCRRSAEIIVLSENIKKTMEEAHGMDEDRIHSITKIRLFGWFSMEKSITIWSYEKTLKRKATYSLPGQTLRELFMHMRSGATIA